MDTIRLEMAPWELSVVPECGGKVASLRSLETGREWLWSNPHLELCPRRPGLDYDGDLDSGGWDEVLPSVVACRVAFGTHGDVAIPDHGELVDLPWRVEEAGYGLLRLSAEGISLPLRFTRTIHFGDRPGTIEFRYELENHGDVEVPFLWAAHPLLNLTPGMRLELPAGTRARVAAVACGRGLVAGTHFRWPLLPRQDGHELDLSLAPDPDAAGFEPIALKVFTERLPRGEVAAVAPDGERLVLRFAVKRVGHLGLWINHRGWSGCGSRPYFNLGLEPTTAPCDSLRDALDAGSALWLRPGSRHEWSLTLDHVPPGCGTRRHPEAPGRCPPSRRRGP